MTRCTCRFCGAAARPHLRRPRLSPLANSYLEPGGARATWSPSTRSVPRLRAAASWSSSGSSNRPSRSSPRTTPTSRRTRTAGSSTAQAYVEEMIERFGLGSAARWSRSPATTATCCSTSSSAGSRCSASSRPRTSPRRPIARGIPTRRRVLRRRHRRPAGRGGPAGRPPARQQRAGARARHQRLRRRHGILLKPGGVDHARVPPPAAADRGEPVRHHLPRALLLPLAGWPSSGLRRPRAARCSTSRSCATHGGSLRDLRAATRRTVTTGDRRGGAPAARKEAAAGARASSRPTPAFRRGSQETKRALLELPDRGAAPGEDRGRLRRAGQGQHPAQLLRRPHRLPRLHRRPQPAQAGPPPARHPHPDPRPERIRETRPDYVLILPWNLREEIIEQMADIREWGGQFVIPIPRVEVLSS